MAYILINSLGLFGEGGAGAGTGGASASGAGSAPASGTAAQASAPAASVAGSAKKGDLSGVQYGVQDSTGDASPAVTAEPAQVNADERRTRFDEMRKGEMKDLFDEWAQSTVQSRLKSTKETVDRYQALTPVLEMLGQKYGVDASDTQALVKAIEEDDAYYEDEALERGVSVADLKAIKKMERENAQLRAEKQEREMRIRADQDVARWMQQEKDAQAVFPNLSLKVEIQNPDFLKLLKSGVDVQTAYFAVHSRELVPKAMEYTARSVEQKIASGIASGRNRPAENGTQSSAAAVVKSDVSQLTKADREEIARRVARGEKIRF